MGIMSIKLKLVDFAIYWIISLPWDDLFAVLFATNARDYRDRRNRRNGRNGREGGKGDVW